MNTYRDTITAEFAGEFSEVRKELSDAQPSEDIFDGLDEELAYHTRRGAFTILLPIDSTKMAWTGEQAIFDAIEAGNLDFANPSEKPPKPDLTMMYELICFDDRDFADRIANACLVAAGRSPRS